MVGALTRCTDPCDAEYCIQSCDDIYPDDEAGRSACFQQCEESARQCREPQPAERELADKPAAQRLERSESSS